MNLRIVRSKSFSLPNSGRNENHRWYDYDSDEDDLGEGSGLKSVGGGGSGGGKKKGSQQQQHSLSSLGVVDSDDESD